MNSYKIQQYKEAAAAKGIDISHLNAHDISNAINLFGDKKEIEAMGYNVAPAVESIFDGSKFPGGFGLTKVLWPDYWTLRERSEQLFEENLYAKGLIRRLVSNEINTGLWPESSPDEDTLELGEGSLDDWSEDVENRFLLWGKTPVACDFKKRHTFNKLQEIVRRESLIGGDVLVMLQQDPITKRPSINLVKGRNILNPVGEEMPEDRIIREGVEMDNSGRHLGYWIRQLDGSSKRVPTFGSRSGRRTAWLVYGTDLRIDTVRGMPLLGVILQSLKELDRYRDNAQRQAAIKSLIAMFIKKTEDKPGTKPISSGAVRKNSFQITDNTTPANTRELNTSSHIPGLVLEELQTGEEPVAFQSNIDINLGSFEEIVINSIAWANELPPEILRLSFSNNYSASQAAINEFKIYLNKIRTDFGEQFCMPVYIEWLISETLLEKIGFSQEIFNAWKDRQNFEMFTAWTLAEWSGAIKPSTDILKQAKGYSALIEKGWITNARATRELTGQKFSRNMRKIKRENEMFVDSMQSLSDFENQNSGDGSSNNSNMSSSAMNALAETIADNVVLMGGSGEDG